jgi:hypothetical protein
MNLSSINWVETTVMSIKKIVLYSISGRLEGDLFFIKLNFFVQNFVIV